jgi:hypothetical protein
MTRATARRAAQKLLRYTGNWSTPVLCIGPGLSMAAGAPSWAEVARLLLRDVKKKWPEHIDPVQAIDLHSHIAGSARTVKLLKDYFGELQSTPAHKSLLSLPWRAILTTNFDTLAEQTFASLNQPYTVWSNTSVKAPTGRENNLIVKLHGSIDEPGNLIITQSDYANRIGTSSRSALQDYVRFLMSAAPAVFIGYSPDSVMDTFFIPYKGGVSDSAKWVLIAPSVGTMEKALLESRGIALVEVSFDSLGKVATELRTLLNRGTGDVAVEQTGKKRILLLGRTQNSQLATQLKAHFHRKGIEVLSLADSPSAGLSLIEKITEMLKNTDHVIFIESSDDPRPSNRARQSTMFELGLAIASVGRDRVILIANREFEAPTDLLGLKYLLVEKGNSTAVVPAIDAMITA